MLLPDNYTITYIRFSDSSVIVTQGTFFLSVWLVFNSFSLTFEFQTLTFSYDFFFNRSKGGFVPTPHIHTTINTEKKSCPVHA